MKSDGIEPEMPRIDGMGFLFRDWTACGRLYAGQPLPWVEVKAYAEIAGLDLTEMQIIRQMSVAYLEGLSMVNPLSISPMELAFGN